MTFWCWILFGLFCLATSSYAAPQVSNGTLPPAFDSDSKTPEGPTSISDPTNISSLPNVAFGSPDAPLKITMYHSLACGHCKDFKENIFPIIKGKFIDTGYVYFVFVDFPTDSSALDAAKVAWLGKDPESYLKISKIIVEMEDEWVGKEDWQERLCKIMENENLMTKEQCKNAMVNEALGNQILKTAFIAQKKYEIDYAPAFILNGKLHKSVNLLSPADIFNELKKLGVEVQK